MNAIGSILGAYLPKGAKEVNEEQLFIAVVSKQLEDKKPGLGKEFHSAVQKEIAASTGQNKKTKTPQLEDVGQKVLLDFEKKGLLSKTDREQIVKTAWTAAQLDDNPALWDSRGSKEDPTIAKSGVTEAENKVQKNLDAIKSGTLKLIDPQGVKPYSGATRTTTESANLASGPDGFLWKPVTNNSGTAAVLFDAALAKQAAKVTLVGPDGKEIAQGRFTSFGEDGKRGKYEFPKPGGDYPDGSSIVITLKNGEKITVALGDPAKRLQK